MTSAKGRRSLSFPADIDTRVKAFAAANYTTINAAYRRLVLLGLNRADAEKGREEAQRDTNSRLRPIVERFENGTWDRVDLAALLRAAGYRPE